MYSHPRFRVPARRVRGCKGHRCNVYTLEGGEPGDEAATQRIRDSTHTYATRYSTRALDRACAAGHAPCVRLGSLQKAEQAARQRNHATILSETTTVSHTVSRPPSDEVGGGGGGRPTPSIPPPRLRACIDVHHSGQTVRAMDLQLDQKISRQK